MNERIKAICVNVIIFVFLNHGILYFFSKDIYQYSNPIKVLKYVLLLLLVASVFVFKKWMRTDIRVILLMGVMIASFFLANSMDSIASASVNEYIVLINYCLPITVLLVYREITPYVHTRELVWATYLFSGVVGYIEFLFLKGHFSKFSDYGYRACSIFINPNNFAAVIFFSTTFILLIEKSILVKMICIINSYLLLFMTGSRSGIVMMSFSVFFITAYRMWSICRRGKVQRKVGIVAFFTIIGMFFALVGTSYFTRKVASMLEGGRRMTEIGLKVGRFQQIIAFIEQIKHNPFFPNKDTCVYVDNVFLHIYGFFGLFALLLFLLFNLWIVVKLWRHNRTQCFLIVLLCVYGVFENYVYLWPMAYIYWFMIGGALLSLRKQKNSIGNNT